MASKSASPSVVGIVDEAGNQVSVGVVEKGKFLPVATAALDSARARDLDAPGKSSSKADDERGEE